MPFISMDKMYVLIPHPSFSVRLHPFTTVPKWVPFRVPGSPRGPFCGFGSPLGLLFCSKVPFFSILD